MSRTTTALVVPRLDGTFEFRNVYLADMRPDEVLVEIHASGICHSDLSCAVGKLPCAPNAVLGHEGPWNAQTQISPRPLAHTKRTWSLTR